MDEARDTTPKLRQRTLLGPSVSQRFQVRPAVVCCIVPEWHARQDGPVDPTTSYPFQSNDEERADAVQSATFVVPN